MMKRPVLFLDRDGVINFDHGHVHQPQDFKLVPGVIQLVRTANTAGLAVVVVTNQAGIAKGYYSEEEYQLLTDWMHHRMREAGARIDAVYHCPHHPEGKVSALKLNCECRKPKPGLLLRAEADLSLNLDRSILVGDKASDMFAGEASAVRHLYLYEGPGVYPSPTSPVPRRTRRIKQLNDESLIHQLMRLSQHD